MTDIDDAWLAERERIRADATPGRWGWHWRKGDEDAPGSIFAEPHTGYAYAVAMCPRYGKDRFSADAAHIVDAHNHQPALIDEIRRLRLLVLEAFDAATSAASTRLDNDPDAAHQAVRAARATIEGLLR